MLKREEEREEERDDDRLIPLYIYLGQSHGGVAGPVSGESRDMTLLGDREPGREWNNESGKSCAKRSG